MALVLTDVRLWAASADLTGASNKIELSASVEEKERTTYGSGGWKEVLGGLGAAEISAEGFWEAGDPSRVDDASWAQLSGAGPWTVAPVGAGVGAPAYLTAALRTSYAALGEVGEVAPYTAKASSTWPLVRGQMAHSPGTPRTASGTGAGVQLGALAGGQQMYASLHVLSVAGATPTLDVAIESAPSAAFAAPTAQLTFSTASAIGAQILRTAGTPVTDTWWRIKWTIGGTTPSFIFAAALGIK